MSARATDNVDRTIASYEAGIDEYLQAYRDTPSIRAFRQTVAGHLPAGARVLELGSGPGKDAEYFESRGFTVTRTDAARAFVERLQTSGHEAYVLDITRDDLPGGFDAVYANAVLLHLTRDQFRAAVEKTSRCVTRDGVLAITMKEGDGYAWSDAKLDLPRYFTYWREDELLGTLRDGGWRTVHVEHVTAREPWINCICELAVRPDAKPVS